MSYSITFEEVREYVESLPDKAPVGICNNPYHCVIAEALLHKYPGDLFSAEVTPHHFINEVDMYANGKQGFREIVTSPDLQRLNRLARAFDHLGEFRRPTKEEVLPLFEE